MHLKAKIAEFEDFKRQTKGYVLNQLDSGTLVYSKNLYVDGLEITVHLCPNCFGRKVVSILQPTEVMWSDAHFKKHCPSCKSDYWADDRTVTA